ncbi:MAG: DUF4416 family protein [bacterium]
MGKLGKPDNALLFIAFAYQKERALDELEKIAIRPFGDIFRKSGSYPFAYSGYYQAEMGPGLQKLFVIYKNLYSIENAVKTKLSAIEIEQQTAMKGKRTINIDPGYLTLAKLVLSTTKNFDHRVYLGQGVFADVQLRYRGGEFVANSWTYPDYREESTFAFLENARSYLHQLVKQDEANL